MLYSNLNQSGASKRASSCWQMLYFPSINRIDWILNVGIMVTSHIEVSIQMRCKLEFQLFFFIFCVYFRYFEYEMQLWNNNVNKCWLVFWLILTKKKSCEAVRSRHLLAYCYNYMYSHILSGDAIQTETGMCLVFTLITIWLIENNNFWTYRLV